MRTLIAVAVVLGAGGAWAGDADDAPAPMARARAIAAAEAHLRAGQAAVGDAALDELEACGQGYLAVFNDAPAAVGADELLYNAATCFAHAGSAGAAITVGEQLVATFPTSRLAPATLSQIARLHQAIGEFERAVDASVRLAERYPAEREAADALWNAIGLSAGLGDDDQVAALAARYQHTYGAKRPDDARQLAVYVAARQAERGDVDGAIAAYQTVLATWRATRGAQAAVWDALADLQWRRACPASTARGLCVRGDARLTPVKRRENDTVAAVAGFLHVVKLAEAGGPDDPMLAQAHARARLHLVERAVEAVVALGAVPPLAVDQDGAPTAAAIKRMGEWLRAWQQAMTTADRAATDAIALPDAPTAVAVVERLARMYRHAAATLIAAPVPKSLVGTPAAAVYRDQLDEVAAPLRQRAQQAAEACLRKAAELGIVDDAVASCGAIVAQAQPAAWVLDELLPPPTATSIAAAPEPVPAPAPAPLAP
ncbi:MAG: hypothetical protein IPH80_00555 [Myxococcales bacterium]|nr:hypothetical protein [Myxococcales bacterium]MBP6846287.1 hypothetical protein [Kofleriaceae bacterium]